MKMISAVNHT